MTKLGIKVDEVPEQVSDPGIYSIKAVSVKQMTRLGLAEILTLNNGNTDKSLIVQHSDQTTSRTNLGRLIKAFTDDPDRWIGKKIQVTFDQDGKRHIAPVV